MALFREFPSFDYSFTQATVRLCCLTLWAIDGPELMFNCSITWNTTCTHKKFHCFQIHQNEDDLGRGTGDARAGSLRTGNAGARLGCGVIARAPLPVVSNM